MNDFQKNKRLLTKTDYDGVFNQASKWVTSGFIFLFCENSGERSRLGLAISKKAVPKAHDRNRLKRILRETFRTRELAAVDVIVLAKRGVDKVPNSVLIAQINKAWDKLIE